MNCQRIIHRYSVCSHIRVARSVKYPSFADVVSVASYEYFFEVPVCCGRSPEFWHYVSGDQAERAPALGTDDFPNDR